MVSTLRIVNVITAAVGPARAELGFSTSVLSAATASEALAAEIKVDEEKVPPSRLLNCKGGALVTSTVSAVLSKALARKKKEGAPASFERNTRLGALTSAKRRLSAVAMPSMHSVQGVQSAPPPVLCFAKGQSTQAVCPSGSVFRGQKTVEGKHDAAPAMLALGRVQSVQELALSPPGESRNLPAGQA